jgi:hypothetical protein
LNLPRISPRAPLDDIPPRPNYHDTGSSIISKRFLATTAVAGRLIRVNESRMVAVGRPNCALRRYRIGLVGRRENVRRHGIVLSLMILIAAIPLMRQTSDYDAAAGGDE